MTEEQSSARSGFTILAVGALIGAGFALLYAPRSETETRKLLVKRTKHFGDKAQDAIEIAPEGMKERKAVLVAGH